MDIKSFLMENYVWLIVIVLLVIITIIGFIADKNRKNKEEKGNSTMNGSVGDPQNSSVEMQNNLNQVNPVAQNIDMGVTPKPVDVLMQPISNNIGLQQPVNMNQNNLNNGSFNNAATTIVNNEPNNNPQMPNFMNVNSNNVDNGVINSASIIPKVEPINDNAVNNTANNNAFFQVPNQTPIQNAQAPNNFNQLYNANSNNGVNVVDNGVNNIPNVNNNNPNPNGQLNNINNINNQF